MRGLTGILAAILLGTPVIATAADLPVKAPPMAAMIVDPWTGFYIGANVGYSAARWDSTSVTGNAIFPAPGGLGVTDSPNVKGWVGGFQAGYNWRVSPTWVVGLEGDFDFSGERASDSGGATTTTFIPFNGNGIGLGGAPGCRVAGCTLTTVLNATDTWKLNWVSTFRGRVGWTPEPTWLLYATGGLAIGQAQFSTTSGSSAATLTRNDTGAVLSTVGTATAAPFSETATRLGYAVGGGIAKKIDRNWSFRAEYLYVDLGTKTFVSGSGSDTSVRLRDNIVRIGVDYRFDPGPVVARY